MILNNYFKKITAAEAIEYCNKNNIPYNHITAEEFRNKVLTQHECGNSLWYTATSGADAVLPFDQAIENISKETDRKYLEVLVSAENQEQTFDYIHIFIHCFDSRASYGFSDYNSSNKITFFICY